MFVGQNPSKPSKLASLYHLTVQYWITSSNLWVLWISGLNKTKDLIRFARGELSRLNRLRHGPGSLDLSVHGGWL